MRQIANNGNGQGRFNPIKLFFHIFDFLWEREDRETEAIDITDSDTVKDELEDDDGDNVNENDRN